MLRSWAGVLRAFAVFAVALTQPGRAQVIPGGPPSEGECRAAAAALRAGNRDGTGWERLAGCGPFGGVELARALDGARGESDWEYLSVIYSSLASIRDPRILQAAIRVMTANEASPPSRIIAVLTGLAQHDAALRPKLGVSLQGFREAATGGRCPIALGLVNGGYMSASPLPADYLKQLTKAFENVAAEQGSSADVKAVARCARTVLSGVAPIQVPTDRIQLEYVCGNRFRVINTSDEWVDVRWRIDESQDRGALTVEPGKPLEFTTRGPGPVTLYYHGTAIRTRPNGGRTCP